MPYVPVFTGVPEVHRWPEPGAELASANQWAFRCLMFYARPYQSAPLDSLSNPWTIRIAQVHLKEDKWRYLSVSTRPNAANDVSAIQVFELPPNPKPVADNFVAEMKFWTTPSYECAVNSSRAQRVEYTHTHFMYHLRDPQTQAKLLANTNSRAMGLDFWRNLIELLMSLRIIELDSLQIFNTKAATLYNSYNVPISEAELRAREYHAAQMRR